MTVVAILVGVLFVAGLVGSVVPWLPGPAFIVVGALVWAVATDFETLGWGRLAILAVLGVLGFILDFLAGAVGARRYGASRWGVIGAIVGAIVGVFLGPFGVILGGVAGAIAGELLRGAGVRGSVRSGLGALLGLLAGIAADLAVSLVMIALFLYWVWRT